MRIESTAASTTTIRSESWYWPCPTNYLSLRPRNLRWLRRVDADRCLQDCPAASLLVHTIHQSVSLAVVQSLVISLVLSPLDYGNAMLVSQTGNKLDRLQSVISATAWLVCSARKYKHITPLLRDLHWLPVRKRIEFKLAVLMFCCVHGTAPPYLANELSCGGHRRKKTAAFCINVCSCNAVIASFDYWWPGLLRCCARLEQFAFQRHSVTDTRHL